VPNILTPIITTVATINIRMISPIPGILMRTPNQQDLRLITKSVFRSITHSLKKVKERVISLPEVT
jgi:hypothetical protein